MTDKVIALIYGIGFFTLLGVAFYAGVFTTSFDENMCYSEVLSHIRDEAEGASAEELELLNDRLQNLPLHGYESNCTEIKNAIFANKK
ncbi:hypothetical protein NBRC116493_02530 [Aurantivibrio infirmus]